MNLNNIKKAWKIGELAQETGLTVRTLHHYDQIGLLVPSQETEGGHRIYNKADLEKLQKILTLKQLGFSLDKIKETIAKKNFSLKEATVQLISEIQKRKIELDEIQSRLESAEKLSLAKDSTADPIIQILSRMTLLEKHLGKEQVSWIQEHNLQLGPERLEELRHEWIVATESIQKALDEAHSPADWKTKSICMQWFGITSALMGGTFDSPYELKKVFESEPKASLHFGLPGIDLKNIFDFVERVLHESKKHPIQTALAYAEVGVQDLSRSRQFYDQVLGLLDMKPIYHRPTKIVYGKTNPEFFISSKSVSNASVSAAKLACVGFWANSTEIVDAVYKKVLECGGTSLQAPGYEDRHLYRCQIGDLDGNTLEVMKWFDDPDKPTG